MARAAAAVVALAAAVCFLLVAPAPARRPVDLPPQVDAVDREAAAEPLRLPKPAVGAVAADADLTTTTTALADPEEEEEEERGPAATSLLCLVFRCDGEANTVAVRKSGGDAQDGWWPWKGDAEARGGDSDSDSDSDCESDSDDEEGEGGIVGWFWSLAHRF